MFNCPGVLICNGTQRYCAKVINSLKVSPRRKSAETNLNRIRCCIKEVSDYLSSDETIWRSLRSPDIQRLTRNFPWKCVHNIFRVGDFWRHIYNLEIFSQCTYCNVDESLEHIMLDCAGQRQVWALCAELWDVNMASQAGRD
ncbi:hypothetical protein C8J57DRAFT_1096195 [Mycena rebaudengoi]|nr:hypothetical protein C8J57DRAFT_1096195 [Mycena rebaudengoi]